MVEYYDFSEIHKESILENQKSNEELKKLRMKMTIKGPKNESSVDFPSETDSDYIMASSYAKIAEDIDKTVENYKVIKKYFSDLCIPENCYDLFEETLASFLNDKHLLTIASVGMTSESFLIHDFKRHLENKKIDGKIIEKRVKAFEETSQYERINILFAFGILSEPTSQILHSIRKNRNDVIHPCSKSLDYKKIASEMFLLLLEILKKYTSLIRGNEQ